MTIKAIITTLDNLPNLRETVTALRGEPLAEIVVINNGSRDGTAEWLAGQSGLTVVNRENRGAGPGRNAGLNAAGEFDYALLLDGGIRPLRGGTVRMLEYLERTPECDVIAPDWHTLETDHEKAWHRWPDSIEGTYRNQVLSLTHYCLSRAKAWNGFRFAEHGPFGEPGWGADDDELAHRWNDAGIVVHAIEGIKVYRRASGSFRRLYQETGIWPTQYGSVYEKRVVWLQQEQPHHGKGIQWGEPRLTVVIEVGEIERAIALIKAAHDKLRERKWDDPWSHIPQPYSVIAWGGGDDFLAWAEPRRLRHHHGDTIILDEYGPRREIVRRSKENEATWTGDFRLWRGERWQDAVRPGAFYYGLVSDQADLTALLAEYDIAHPPRESWTETPEGKGELTRD